MAQKLGRKLFFSFLCNTERRSAPNEMTKNEYDQKCVRQKPWIDFKSAIFGPNISRNRKRFKLKSAKRLYNKIADRNFLGILCGIIYASARNLCLNVFGGYNLQLIINYELNCIIQLYNTIIYSYEKILSYILDFID